MGSLQDELKRKLSPPVASQGAAGPSCSLAESLETVCREFADRLQPFITQLDKGQGGDLREVKAAVKMLHERAVNARRVAAAVRQ